MAKEFNIHDWQAKINEQGFDDRLKNKWVCQMMNLKKM